MALSWDITNCNESDSLRTESEWFKTEHMIFATMAIDMDEITEKNVGEFYSRLLVIGNLIEGSWFTNGEWEMVTFTDVQKRIGLNTNAYSSNTFNQWLNRMQKSYPKTSKNNMLAIYYSAKTEIEQLMKETTTHIERNESFAFDLVARSGA